MKLKKIATAGIPVLLTALFTVSCQNDDDTQSVMPQSAMLTVENVLQSQPLVQSGTFQGDGTPPVVFPGESVSISFYAAKGQALSFATMYGWSNDLFFAPENPGITLYTEDGTPIEGDVSQQIKLWDNGTRVNQAPGPDVEHPGEATSANITEISGMDAEGNSYLPASQLVNANLTYNGNSNFTLTLMNTSDGTQNETPISPGVWAISYIAGGNLLNPVPLYQEGQPTANGLTDIAETGNNAPLYEYIQGITGVFTPLSPILVVIYSGDENPFYKTGENDRGEGLKEIAQKGDASVLASALENKAGVKSVYILAQSQTTVLLPSINGQPGGSVSQEIMYDQGDRIAIATMYGFSNDWFFATEGNGVAASYKGDISGSIKLYDDGTALDQYPGAGITQFNLAGTPLNESKPIEEVPNPNTYTTLPAVSNIIKATLN